MEVKDNTMSEFLLFGVATCIVMYFIEKRLAAQDATQKALATSSLSSSIADLALNALPTMSLPEDVYVPPSSPPSASTSVPAALTPTDTTSQAYWNSIDPYCTNVTNPYCGH
jgi:hypothetical protein